MDQNEIKFYQCKECKQTVLGKLGAVSHARTHGLSKAAVDEAGFSKLFRLVKDPPKEIAKQLLRKRAYQKKYSDKRKGKVSKIQKRLKGTMPEIVGLVGEPQLQQDGIVLTILVKVPIAFGLPQIVPTE